MAFDLVMVVSGRSAFRIIAMRVLVRRIGVRKRIAAYGTALELLDRYNDLELAQVATQRGGEVIGLAIDARMFGCVLIEKPDPMRTARVHRVIEFATALLPLCALARTAMAEDTTAPRSRQE